ncbi:type II secretion system F family protein [Orrella marina]|uniref:Type II secretion system protein GspF domain-containing protein n=1 Tax=Orrella marina TaxID=2163011 RepID=A0A2R4XI18_9BURK|nr:type II secretion system F family protein [Orrella marina]AWB33466.1 hypothetical protein DBV39_06820 [Orrella marina]
MMDMADVVDAGADSAMLLLLVVMIGWSVLLIWLFSGVRSKSRADNRNGSGPVGGTAAVQSPMEWVRSFTLRQMSWSMRIAIERKLMHAGLIRWQVTDLVLLHVGCVLCAGILGVLCEVSTWMIPVCMLIAVFLIESWVGQRQRAYSSRIAMHLPGFLDMLCLCLSAGMSFNAGLLVVLKYMPDGPLRMLWRDWLFDVRAGSTRVEALTRLMNKSTQGSLQRLCIAMIQAERTGSALAASLHSQSGQLRQDHLLAAERRAAQAPMRMLLPLVMCFFPSTFLVLAFSIWVGVADAF